MHLEPTDLTAGPLHLRPWRDDLVPRLTQAAATDDHAGAWVRAHGGPAGRVAHELAGWADGSRATFAVLESTTAAVIGHVGLVDENRHPTGQGRAEIGLWVVTGQQGRGVGRTVLGVVSRWAFATGGLARISFVTAVDNHAARRAAEAVGFVPEGIARSMLPAPTGDGRVDAWLAALLPGEA